MSINITNDKENININLKRYPVNANLNDKPESLLTDLNKLNKQIAASLPQNIKNLPLELPNKVNVVLDGFGETAIPDPRQFKRGISKVFLKEFSSLSLSKQVILDVGFEETFIKQMIFNRFYTDTDIFTDTLQLEASKIFNDNIISSDVLSKDLLKNILENLSLSEYFNKDLSKNLIDSDIISDSYELDLSLIKVDSQTTSDLKILDFSKALNEALTSQSVLTKNVSKPFSESSIFSEILIKSNTKGLIENFSWLDLNIRKSIEKVFNEAPYISFDYLEDYFDYFVYTPRVTDSFNLSIQPAYREVAFFSYLLYFDISKGIVSNSQLNEYFDRLVNYIRSYSSSFVSQSVVSKESIKFILDSESTSDSLSFDLNKDILENPSFTNQLVFDFNKILFSNSFINDVFALSLSKELSVNFISFDSFELMTDYEREFESFGLISSNFYKDFNKGAYSPTETSFLISKVIEKGIYEAPYVNLDYLEDYLDYFVYTPSITDTIELLADFNRSFESPLSSSETVSKEIFTEIIDTPMMSSIFEMVFDKSKESSLLTGDIYSPEFIKGLLTNSIVSETISVKHFSYVSPSYAGEDYVGTFYTL